LNLDFTHEAKSLKRVDVPNPLARILAVDDEPVVLDSFRKILVVAGYAIDTVESGREALGLVQKHKYDFAFTDLKMPEMDGLDVVKGVKHFSPETDVIVITGYATIESAVNAMKFGAGLCAEAIYRRRIGRLHEKVFDSPARSLGETAQADGARGDNGTAFRARVCLARRRVYFGRTRVGECDGSGLGARGHR
jgi:CheY-like chemotaxis protein